MSDDFQTVSAKRGDRAREIETLRARYRKHREALSGLVADAPSELIAADYRRVIADIDVALAKLDVAGSALPPPPPPPTAPLRLETEPGMRPLVTSHAVDDDSGTFVREGTDARTRMILIVLVTVVGLAIIAWVIWKAADRPETGAVVEQPSTTATEATTTEAVATVAPIPAQSLTITPDTMDYGIIRKGTRATRQYEIVNNSDEPLSPQVARSSCRCLYYEHAPVVPPRAKETLTVTVDGAKAKSGPLIESVKVTSKSDPSVVATFDVAATIR